VQDQPRHNNIVHGNALPEAAQPVLARRGGVVSHWRTGRVMAIVVVAVASVLVAVEGDRAWRAGTVVAALAILGVPLAVVGFRACARRPALQLDARAIRRRAWIVLPIAAVVLATVMAGIAVKPALLGILAIVASLYIAVVGGGFALCGLVHLYRVWTLPHAGRQANVTIKSGRCTR
jgi:hypothetical protein